MNLIEELQSMFEKLQINTFFTDNFLNLNFKNLREYKGSILCSQRTENSQDGRMWDEYDTLNIIKYKKSCFYCQLMLNK